MAKAFLLLFGAIGIAAVKANDSCDEGELANVQMLQTKSKIEADTPLTRWTGTSHFFDNNGIACAEGTADNVDGALALRKAGLLGAMYDNVHANQGSCKSKGFGKHTEADDCYPGITMSFKTKNGSADLMAANEETLNAYAMLWGLGQKKALHLYECTCHKNSVRRDSAAMACPGALQNMNGSYFQIDALDNSTALTCAEGPFYEATMSLAVLKTTRLMTMHMLDQVAPFPCSQRGFVYAAPHPDPCFAGMHFWSNTSAFHSDWGVQRMATGINILTERAGPEGEWYKLGVNKDIMGRKLGCHCSAQSHIRKVMNDEHIQCAMGSTSPIRDWWVD